MYLSLEQTAFQNSTYYTPLDIFMNWVISMKSKLFTPSLLSAVRNLKLTDLQMIPPRYSNALNNKPLLISSL